VGPSVGPDLPIQEGNLPLRGFDQNRIRGWLGRVCDASGRLSGDRPDEG
jgi:hypothetical protein